MSISYNPGTIMNGLEFFYDMSNTDKSWKGSPTTNLLESASLGIYNNVPSHVTCTLTQTSDTYRGVPVWLQTITPTTASGVGYLTGGANPGIGVVSGGGGGTANRYTGFSIFFKASVPLHSSPIYTNYSNIPGWVTGGNFDSLGDGWYRAHVIWYDTTTRSDGKYWAINPATVPLNTTINVYWAGPFKEDRNDSLAVSQFVNSSRSTTNSLVDLTGTKTITIQSLTYTSQNNFTFNGTSDWVDCTLSSGVTGTGNWTMEAWFRIKGSPSNTSYQNVIIDTDATGGSANMIAVDWGGYHGGSQMQLVYTTRPSSGGSYTNLLGPVLNKNVYYHVCVVRNGSSNTQLYVNGKLFSTYAGNMPTATQPLIRIGRWTDGTNYSNADIPVAKVYNRSLNAGEILQNYSALAGRYRFEVPPTGLILHLDAANSQSYPGSGSTWYDLSGQGNHFTLAGTLSHSTVSGFTGFTQANYWYRAGFPQNLKSGQGGNGLTTIVYARCTTVTGWQKLIGNGDEQNYIDLYAASGSANYASECSSTLYYNNGINVANSAFYMADSVWRAYIATNLNTGLTTNPTDQFGIGGEGQGDRNYPWQGNILAVLIYNRVLTTAEMTTVYNALYSKYGTA